MKKYVVVVSYNPKDRAVLGMLSGSSVSFYATDAAEAASGACHAVHQMNWMEDGMLVCVESVKEA